MSGRICSTYLVLFSTVFMLCDATQGRASDGERHTGWQIAQALRGAVSDAPKPKSTVQRIRIAAKRGVSVLELDMSRAVKADAFVLGKPYRVIVDMPEVGFQVGNASGSKIAGDLVRAYRFGKFAPGRSRIVVDVKDPVVLTGMKFSRLKSGLVRLRLVIRKTTLENFRRLSKAGLIGPPKSRRTRKRGAARPSKSKEKRLVVVIDPGHGGIDPGAIAGKNVAEKTVVLAVGLELRKLLAGRKKYRVLMTREKDEFVSLRDRRDFSVENGAALFLSLHADALGEAQLAQSVRGASVYTLSGKASDAVAKRLADKENSADLAAGLELADGEGQDEVRNILIDLMRRETSMFSAKFKKTLLSKMRGKVRLSKTPARSAAFAVLKQTETPSVLIELGYVSNPSDRKNLMSVRWRRDVAKSIARAVDAYFASKSAVRH